MSDKQTKLDELKRQIVPKAAYRVDYTLLEEIIKTYFKIDEYEIPVLEERGSGDGASWEVFVEEKLPIYKSDIEDIVMVRDGTPVKFGTRTILNYLAFHGAIPAGQYIIDISW